MRNILVKRSTDLLWAPRQFRQEADFDHWPQCFLCKQAVEAIENTHVGSTSAEFVARCHGDHAALKIRWALVDGDPPSDAEISKVLGNSFFFDPSVQVG